MDVYPPAVRILGTKVSRGAHVPGLVPHASLGQKHVPTVTALRHFDSTRHTSSTRSKSVITLGSRRVINATSSKRTPPIPG